MVREGKDGKCRYKLGKEGKGRAGEHREYKVREVSNKGR